MAEPAVVEVAQPEGAGAAADPQQQNDVPLPEADDDELAAAMADFQLGPNKKKKRKKTSKARRKITGFEEFYADPPMTPAEALEKKNLYSMKRPFADRIEECIQRYRARRRMDQERVNMFNKYLFLGGIDSSPRQFTGMVDDKEAFEEADAQDIRTMTATDFVGGSGDRFYDPAESDKWEVDFEAVVKGFLSRTIPEMYMYDAKATQTAADLVKNFLNYVLMQDVCPEYASNVMAARQVCDTAPTEMEHIHQLSGGLPGTFNRIACELFCDGKINSLDQGGNVDLLVQFRLGALLWPLGEKIKQVGEKIKQVGEKIMQVEDPSTMHVVSTVEKTYLVVGIERPRRKHTKSMQENIDKVEPNRKLTPAGVMRAKPAIIGHGWGNMPRPGDIDFSEAEETEFILEDDLLAKFEMGMKLHMTVCELNVGLCFIKHVSDIRVSFDEFLPQHLMLQWKQPETNERPPPSVHDYKGAEEEPAMDGEMEDEA
ncbi:Argonaute complex, subunit Arb1 [Xylariaceae sp. FL0594]|nr:Argonaute complex, subunit Arb1 [Xylariaceae sp. FL0594]